MERFWLLTWTTYGTWLPGDRRGFVSNVADSQGNAVRHNIPGTRCDKDIRGLHSFAEQQLAHEPVMLERDQASALADQFRETAQYRGWNLLAAAVMRNHVHLVVRVEGDPAPDTLLRDFKSYGSRRLNRLFEPRERWWTQSGSKRKLPDSTAAATAVRYVRNQQYPLIVWLPDEQPPNGGRSPEE
jgi:REP element-mobilizing transposase RayT